MISKPDINKVLSIGAIFFLLTTLFFTLTIENKSQDNNIMKNFPKSQISSRGWSRFGHDDRNTRRNPVNTSKVDGTVKWKYQPQGQVSPYDIVMGSSGNLYFGTEKEYLYSLYPNGTLKWKIKTEIIPYYLSIDKDSIYIASNSGGDNLYAFNKNGTFKWKSDSVYQMSLGPAIGEDRSIYFGTGNDTLVSLNPDGTKEWQQKINGTIAMTPAIDIGKNLYVVSNNGNFGYLTAISNNGTLLWEQKTENPIYSLPSIGEDGSIYAGTDKLHAFTKNGTEKWVYETNTKISTSFAVGKNGDIFFGCRDGRVYSIKPGGTKNWVSGKIGIVSTPAIGGDGTIYFGTESSLYAMNSDGSKKWSHKIGDDVFSPIIGEEGKVYVGSYDGRLYAFGSSDEEKSNGIPGFTSSVLFIILSLTAIYRRVRRNDRRVGR